MKWNVTLFCAAILVAILAMGHEVVSPVILADEIARRLAMRVDVPEQVLRRELVKAIDPPAGQIVMRGVYPGIMVILLGIRLIGDWRTCRTRKQTSSDSG